MKKEKVDVLIVDDRLDGLIALEAVLQSPEVNLVKASSGPEALRALVNHDFAAILLDVQMPEMDGFETARLIRLNENFKHTPIVFVTAINKDDQYIYKGYEVGAVDYIFKPFEPQILRSKVQFFIDLYLKSKQLKDQANFIRESERRERYLRLAELEVESLKRYRNLADSIPHMVWRARGDGTLEYFNRGWINYTGLSLEQSVGMGWQAVVHSEDLKGFLKTWMNSMTTGEAFEFESRIRRADGEMRWHWVRAVPEGRVADTAIAWLGTCTDIHDRKLAEQRLIVAEREANAANLSKTSFLANMSHEIRTPMNAILGFTELMLDPTQSPEERKECIETVHRSGSQLLKLIDEILDISKVEAGYLQVEKVETNVGLLLSDLESLLGLQASEKGLKFQFRVQGSVPNIIFSDPTRLRQILLNIIGNAIKFTQAGEVDIEISWTPLKEEKGIGRMQFRVRDTGVGIESSQVEKLFHPFVQVDSSTTRHFGGTGLGLALSRQLAKALDGDVVLETSAPGVGSTFVVSIEATALDSSDLVYHMNLSNRRMDGSSLRVGKILKDVNVLLVEDVVENRELIKRFLTLAGAHVEVAGNGVEGIRKALSGNFKVILMDIQMPKMDGYEATQRLRSEGYKAPIIALTAHALKEEKERCLEVGCDYHLTKPIGQYDLIQQVAKVLNNHNSLQN